MRKARPVFSFTLLQRMERVITLGKRVGSPLFVWLAVHSLRSHAEFTFVVFSFIFPALIKRSQNLLDNRVSGATTWSTNSPLAFKRSRCNFEVEVSDMRVSDSLVAGINSCSLSA